MFWTSKLKHSQYYKEFVLQLDSLEKAPSKEAGNELLVRTFIVSRDYHMSNEARWNIRRSPTFLNAELSLLHQGHIFGKADFKDRGVQRLTIYIVVLLICMYQIIIFKKSTREIATFFCLSRIFFPLGRICF